MRTKDIGESLPGHGLAERAVFLHIRAADWHDRRDAALRLRNGAVSNFTTGGNETLRSTG
ncbi:MAG: hypothetical protein J5954_00955 [Prevotella sp.]|nr:hypothetical protein [Prevotella sp.]